MNVGSFCKQHRIYLLCFQSCYPSTSTSNFQSSIWVLTLSRFWQVPYYWAGCKLYDMLAGRENMETSYIMSKGKALETFPMLKSDGLAGALVYYDGKHGSLPCQPIQTHPPV